MTYVNLQLNPERYTSCTGPSAKRIWDAIYSKNCPLYSRPKLVAGSSKGYSGHVDGKLGEARMNHPKGLTVDDRGNIYVADTKKMTIRKISDTVDPDKIGGYAFKLLLCTQVGSQPSISVAWLPVLRILVTLSKDGTLQVWKTRVVLNSNRPPMQANFFEPAGGKKSSSELNVMDTSTAAAGNSIPNHGGQDGCPQKQL